jgi:hypothetical protein
VLRKSCGKTPKQGFSLNINMTTEMNQKKSINAKTGKPKVSSRGGARKGAGRPPGARNRITVQDLLTAIDTHTGTGYEELLIQDFITARQGNDNHLIHKYHTLIAGKILSTLATVEVADTRDAVTAKQAAFAEAIAQITQKTQSD